MIEVLPFLIVAFGVAGAAWGASSLALYWAASDYRTSQDYAKPGFRPYEVKGPPDEPETPLDTLPEK